METKKFVFYMVVAVLSLALGYFFLGMVVTSSFENEAISHSNPLSYLADHSADRHLGLTYEGVKRFSNEGYMDMVIQAESGSGIVENVNAERFLASRLDNAGFTHKIEGMADGRFRIHVEHVLDSSLVKQLVTKNINVEIFETDGYGAYSFIEKMSKTETTQADTVTAEQANQISDRLRAVFQFPGQNSTVVNPRLGECDEEDTASVRNLFKIYSGSLPKNTLITFAKERTGKASIVLLKFSNRPGQLRSALQLNTLVTDVTKKYDPLTDYSLSVELNQKGAMLWSRITRDNSDRMLAIAVDGLVYSMPMVLGEISNGKLEIANLTNREAILVSAALESSVFKPVTFKIVEAGFVPMRLAEFTEIRNSFWVGFAGCLSCLTILAFMAFQCLKRISIPKSFLTMRASEHAVLIRNRVLSFMAKYHIGYWLIVVTLAAITVHLTLKMVKILPYNPIEFADVVITGLATFLFTFKNKAGWYLASCKILITIVFASGYLLSLLVKKMMTTGYYYQEPGQLPDYFVFMLVGMLLLQIVMFSDLIRTTFGLPSKKTTFKNLLLWMLWSIIAGVAIVVLVNVAKV